MLDDHGKRSTGDDREGSSTKRPSCTDLNLNRSSPFADHAAFAPLIPLETLPLDLHSLAGVLATGSGVAAGAWAGVVA